MYHTRNKVSPLCARGAISACPRVLKSSTRIRALYSLPLNMQHSVTRMPNQQMAHQFGVQVASRGHISRTWCHPYQQTAQAREPRHTNRPTMLRSALCCVCCRPISPFFHSDPSPQSGNIIVSPTRGGGAYLEVYRALLVGSALASLVKFLRTVLTNDVYAFRAVFLSMICQ